MTESVRCVDDLAPSELENMTYDILQMLGFVNLVWRTPGADGGRDIEGNFTAEDISGETHVQKWYVECKRYESSLDWPTVWKKVAYADNRGADFLLLVTNSNPSPNCESEIALWNAGRTRTRIRVWRGYSLESILKDHPAIESKYGLRPNHQSSSVAFVELAKHVMSISQSAYVAFSLGRSADKELGASAAIAELLSLRMSDIATYNRMVRHLDQSDSEPIEWATISGEPLRVFDTLFRAAIMTFRYVTNSPAVSVDVAAGLVKFTSCEARLNFSKSSEELLASVLIWCDAELLEINKDPPSCLMRFRS